MAQNIEDNEPLRQYLLGDISDEDRDQIEKRLMTDDEFSERLSMVEDDLVDDYVAEALSEEERERFETHYLLTGERREQVEFARSLSRYLSKPSPVVSPEPIPPYVPFLDRIRAFFTPTLVAALIVILAVILPVGIWRAFYYQDDVDKGIAVLKSAYRSERPVEARISDFDYAPKIETRGGQQQESLERERAHRLLLDAAAKDPSARSYHALGQYYLSQKDFDKAIAQFELALKEDEKNAQLHNDLGAALVERGKAARASDDTGKGIEDFARALDRFNRALEVEASLLEALFNRALVYEEMMLPDRASQDWQSYLEKDPDSRWAEEARRHLRIIEEQKSNTSKNEEELFNLFAGAYDVQDGERAWDALKQGRTRGWNFIAERLLDDYLRLSLEGPPDLASRKMDMLSFAGRVELDKGRDRFTTDLAEFYASATAAQKRSLVSARNLMSQGDKRYGESRLKEARLIFTDARKVFLKAGDRCQAKFADYRIGFCYLREPDLQASISTLERVAESSVTDKHPWLEARAYYALAITQMALNRYSTALDYSSRALAIYKQTDDVIGQASINVQIAAEYQHVGDYRRSLAFLQQSLAVANNYRLAPSQISDIYDVTSDAFTSLGLYWAAIDYQLAGLSVANRMGVPLKISRCHSYLGTMYARINRYDEAIKNVLTAFDIGKSLAGESIGLEMMAFSSLHLGQLYRETGDYAKAVASYNQNIEIYEKLNYPYQSYAAHKGKFLSLVASGDQEAARGELELTLKLFEQYREKIVEDDNKNSFFDSEQDIYDLAIGFQYSNIADPARAFEYSEASRARSLLDMVETGAQVTDHDLGTDLSSLSGARPLTLEEICDRMPDEAQLLQYAMLSDRVIIWVISKTGFASAEKKIGSEDLTARLLGYLQAIKSGEAGDSGATLDQSRELYDTLIAPIAHALDKTKYLCVVPDKALGYLPFASLASPDSGSYLVSDYLLTFSPSSSLFIICSDAARKKASHGPEKLLSVGNPSFSRALFPSLSDLPSSEREARQVAALYSPATCYVRDAARESQVTGEMARADVIHLATHFVLDDRSPLMSKLLLAKEQGGGDQQKFDGILQSQEIYRVKLPRAKLAVLSACQTGIERSFRGEGAVSIARPFMTAGVPVVVASLWPVDSVSTSDLMIDFHKKRKRERVSTAEALRRA
ncbi:MAG TPA: CHAT domain-containing protein, partial [Blastocatellia bacterium]|nr:CHAT domain-containing protein [Blastocatellia bacterium]